VKHEDAVLQLAEITDVDVPVDVRALAEDALLPDDHAFADLSLVPDLGPFAKLGLLRDLGGRVDVDACEAAQELFCSFGRGSPA
jgi:hypothetical protein